MNIQVAGQPAGAAGAFQRFELKIAPFSGRELHVMALEGREEISHPYSFEVWFTCTDILEPARAVGQDASIELTTGNESFLVAGVVTQFDCDDPNPNGDFTYRLVIGPHFALTQLSRQNQVYGTETPITVKDIIGGKLNNSLSARSTAGAGVQPIKCDLRIMGEYPQRDHVAQFEESDFTFLSRTCEHHGVFYFFEHARGGETIVFADSNVAFRQAAGPASLPFRLTRGQADDASVSSFRASAKPVPRTVYVRDYDDTQASTELLASQTVDRSGFGSVVEYGANFSAMNIGIRFAQIRAEEQAARKIVYHGISTSPGLRPGTFFTLSGHPNHALNGRYVVIAASHSAGDTLTRKGPYENRFEAIPFATPYRPHRKTSRPTAGGLFNATIDSSSEGLRADVDPNGRYRLRHVYDESNSPAGQASTYVRQAQPYAGKSDTGFHLPLLKDTAVVVGYVNGDPDRPMIVGAVPGSTTPSVVTRTNQITNRMRTTAGHLFEINDGAAAGGGISPYVRLVGQTEQKLEFRDASYIRLGTYVGDESTLLPNAAAPKPVVTSSTVETESFSSSKAYQQASLQSAQAKGTLTSDQQQGNTQSNKTQKRVSTPTDVSPSGGGILLYSDRDLMVNTLGAAYVKYGKGHGTVVVAGDAEYDVPAGQYTLKAQNGVTITAGTSGSSADINLTAYNYINQKAYGPLDEVTYGDSYKNVHGNAIEYFLGTKQTWVIDAEVSGKLAASATLFMGVSTTLKFSVEMNLTIGAVVNFKMSAELTMTLGAKVEMIYGADIKIVGLCSMKIVYAEDMSFVTSGFKSVNIDDVKIVTGIDFKNATIDTKFVQAFLERKGIDLSAKSVEISNASLKTRMEELQVKMCGLDTQTSSIKTII